MSMVSVGEVRIYGKGRSRSSRKEKAAPFLEPLSKRGKKEGFQERRCEKPIRELERHVKKCREQRVKVISSAASFITFGKKHLPRQRIGLPSPEPRSL
jgi:hypothetical protein